MSRRSRRLLAVLLGLGAPLAGVLVLEGLLAWRGVGEEPALQRRTGEYGTLLYRQAAPAPRGAMTSDRLAAQVPKPPGTFRIVVVGESTAAGFPWYPWFSFGRILEQRLRESATASEVEVVNFARAADSSDRVREVALAALEAEPDLLLICSGHNDYQVPYDQGLRAGPGAAWRRLLRRSRLIKSMSGAPITPLVTAPRLPVGRLIGAQPFLDDTERARGVERFQANLERVLDACLEAGVPCVLLTQAANLGSFPPSYSSFSTLESPEQQQDYERRLERVMQQVAQSTVTASTEAELSALLGLDKGVALAHYLQGQVWQQMGRLPEAGLAFDRALALDSYPNRAPPAFNDVIRRMASRQQVQVLDVVAAFGQWSAGARPGHDQFLDHCHPTVEGTFRLAEFVREGLQAHLEKSGVLTSESLIPRDPTDPRHRQELLGAMGVEPSALAEMTLGAGRLNLMAWLETPSNEQPLALAENAFRITLSVVPNHSDALAGLVALHLARGQREQALTAAMRAVQADPTALAALDQLCRSNQVMQAALERTDLQFVGGQLVDKP